MSDWRLQGQESYLTGVKIKKSRYKLYSEGWEHDHCEFCWAQFSLKNGDLQEGYTTEDNYRWICAKCYDDFKEKFQWKL